MKSVALAPDVRAIARDGPGFFRLRGRTGRADIAHVARVPMISRVNEFAAEEIEARAARQQQCHQKDHHRGQPALGGGEPAAMTDVSGAFFSTY